MKYICIIFVLLLGSLHATPVHAGRLKVYGGDVHAGGVLNAHVPNGQHFSNIFGSYASGVVTASSMAGVGSQPSQSNSNWDFNLGNNAYRNTAGVYSAAYYRQINGDHIAPGNPCNGQVGDTNHTTQILNNMTKSSFFALPANTHCYVDDGLDIRDDAFNLTSTEGSRIIYVIGNLDIAHNVAVEPGLLLMFIVSGDVYIDDVVSALQGVIVTNLGIDVLGGGNTSLVFQGTMATPTGYSKKANSSAADESLYYRPSFLRQAFIVRQALVTNVDMWREVAP